MRPELAGTVCGMRTSSILAAVFVTACAGDDPCGPGGAESARMRLLATDVEFSRHASEAGLAPAFETVLMPEAVFLPMNSHALYGPDDIIAFFAGNPDVRMRWTPADAEVGGRCDIGYTYGAWSAQVNDGDGGTQDFSGKYLGTWRLQPERGWRLAVYMQNADPILPPEAPPAEDD